MRHRRVGARIKYPDLTKLIEDQGKLCDFDITPRIKWDRGRRPVSQARQTCDSIEGEALA
jgi:hypothetical protein